MAGTNPSYLLLGPVAVAHDGALLDLGPPQRRAVLARLALVPGRAISADHLVEALWGERPPATARKAVQVQISRLRAQLPDGAIERAGAGYALRADPDDVDLSRFERLVAASRSTGDVREQRDLLGQALGLWRGPALADLVDLPFAAAAIPMDELRQEALDARIRADLALGEHRTVVPELEGLVGLHPEREALWEHLVVALYGAGRQADALRAYERARRYLGDEHGLDPGPALQALHRRVLDHDPDLAPRVRAVGAAVEADVPSVRPAADRPRPALPELPELAGRDEALAALATVAGASASDGRLGIAVIEGEEGFGKTAVLAAFAARAEGDPTVLLGRSSEGDAVPYEPWVAVLGQLGAGDAVEGLDALVHDVESGEARRRELFRSTTAALRDAAADRPVLLLLDDLHWADEATTRLLLHVLRELGDVPVTVVLAWRPRDVGIGSPAVAVAEHVAKVRCLRLPLAPLDEVDVASLLERHDASAGDRVLVRRIVEATGGVPLFVTDVLDDLDAARASGDNLLPETARSITARRLTRAGGRSVEVAKAASLLADPISLEVLGDLLPELEYAETLDAVDRLIDVGLLVDAEAGPGFAHAAFRAAVRSSIPAGRRQVLHASAFQRLRLEPVPAAALAQHAEGGGRLVPPAEASGALDRAGREAAGRGAFADAAGYFGRAVVLAPEAGWAEAKVNHADALWRAGDLATAKATAADVVERRRARPDAVSDLTLARAVSLHGTIGAGFGPDAASIALTREAIDLVHEPEAAARCAGALAYHLAGWGGERALTWAAIADARERIDDRCPPVLRDELDFTVGLAMLESPDLEARRAQATELAERGRTANDPRMTGRGLRLLGMAQLSGGEVDDLERTADQVAVIAEQTGSWMYESDVYRWRSSIAFERGDLDGMRRAIADLDRLAADPLAGWVLVGTQHLLLRHREGDLDGAMAFVEGVRTALPWEGRWSTDRMLAELYRIGLLFEMGQPDAAAGALDELAPWDELHLSSCRRYPAELAMIAGSVASAQRTDVADRLAGLVAPYRGQHVVLGWGEGLLGTFEERWQALQPWCAVSEVPS